MLAIVSHDAGGAEILSSFVRDHRDECLFVLDGPAVRVFNRKLGGVTNMPLATALKRADRVLCGSSWQSDLEYDAVRLARESGIQSATFVDHWVNYRERFTRRGITILPDELWVADVEAEKLATAAFPQTPIRRVDNPYLADLRKELAEVPTRPRDATRGLAVLYVCEPIREAARRQFGDELHWGYSEEGALRFFLSNVAALAEPVAHIVIRPHPSEEQGKYRWAETEFDHRVLPGGLRSLLEEIVESDVVVGCESMALVVGLLAGKRVVSSIPPGGKPCALPQPDIEHLTELVAPRWGAK